MTDPRTLLRRLRGDTSGLALMEFAFILPILVTLSLTGAELTNYITVKMRMSQLALQIADNAARMGTGSAVELKQITETDINDIFAGAQLGSGRLDLKTNGRVILSDIETKAGGANPYKVAWKRCYGNKTTYTPMYPRAGQDANDLTGIGPVGREVTAQDSTPTMFVELYYVYRPIFAARVAPTTTLTEIASMSVRDRRDLTRIYNTAGATIASC